MTETGQTPKRRSANATLRYLALYAACTGALLLAIFYNKGKLGPLPPPHTALRYLCALIPALPMAALIWLQVTPPLASRDEFQRLIQLRAAAGALGGTVVVLSGWGFLSELADVAPIEPFNILMLVIILGAPAQIIAMWKYR